MKITIIGSGYVSLVTGTCLVRLGNDMFCFDVDQKKIDLLNISGVLAYELGLKELIERNRVVSRAQFPTDVAANAAYGDMQFIAVGTSSDKDGSADLKYILAAVRSIAQRTTGFKVIVNKSMVPMGTDDEVRAMVDDVLTMRGKSDVGFSAVSNPEFLKEGTTVDDLMHPDRIVPGTHDDIGGLRAKVTMRMFHAPFNRNHEWTSCTDVRSAKLTKYTANSMFATRVSFMDEMANLVDKVDADIEFVRLGIGSNPRIGHSLLYAGIGYGRSCFPKDAQVLVRMAQEYGQTLHVLEAIEAVNNKQKEALAGKTKDRLGAGLTGRTFAIQGLASKPNTGNMRKAPSRILIAALLTRGAHVQVYNPVVMEEAHHMSGLDLSVEQLKHVTFCVGQMDTFKDVNALVIVTEWKAFCGPDFNAAKVLLRTPMVSDGRNLFEPQVIRGAGFGYQVTRRSIQSQSSRPTGRCQRSGP